MRPILIVEDEHPIADLIELTLTSAGYTCEQVNDGETAADRIAEQDYELAILDIMLPKVDGYELLRYLRSVDTPVIFVTAKAALNDRVRGLHEGADDYLTKPFEPLELVARVKAQLRRYTSYGTRDQTEDSLLSVNGLTINRDARQVTVDEKPVRTTPLEYAILLYLVEHRGKVVPVEELFRAVWNEEFMAGSNNTVMVHIRHLREKIGDDAQNPRFIRNIWGVGYTIDA